MLSANLDAKLLRGVKMHLVRVLILFSAFFAIQNIHAQTPGPATYQWVGASCDLVSPNGYVVSSGFPISYCGGSSYQWIGASCDIVTPAGYVVSSGFPSSYCGGATYQWEGASCDLVAPDGYVVSSGFPASYCGAQ
jgi:hypothetical protein